MGDSETWPYVLAVVWIAAILVIITATVMMIGPSAPDDPGGIDDDSSDSEDDSSKSTERRDARIEDMITLDEWINDDDRSYDGFAGTKSGGEYEDVIKWGMPAEDSDSTTWKGVDYSCREGSTETVEVGLQTKSGEAVDFDTVDFPCDGETHAFGVQVHPGGRLEAYLTL